MVNSHIGDSGKNVETKSCVVQVQGLCAVVEMGDGVRIEGNVCPARRRYAFLNDAGERIEADLDDVMVFSATGNVVEFPSGQPFEPAVATSEAVPIEITFFRKDNGLLTKTIHRGPDGRVVIDSSECRMSSGQMERVILSDWRGMAQGLEHLPDNTAIALGRMRPDLLDKVFLTTKYNPDCQ
jgi:hypothetical protein